MSRLPLLAILLPTLAWAQDAIVATPLPPPDSPAPATPEALPPPVWLPKGTVLVQALDKVNAKATGLTIKVGETMVFGSIRITAKACNIRPPDVPADAAAFLVVTDSSPNAPGFSGWMLRSSPSVSMLEHPIYDLRITGCGN